MLRRVLQTLALLLCIVGCGNSSSEEKTLVVFAAASLTDVFSDMAKDFEKENPGIQVKLSFAGSQSLRTQIQNGAKPDIFASANPKHMNKLKKAGLVKVDVPFVLNRLVVATSKSSPPLRDLQELPLRKRLVLAGPHVPAGAYAERMLRNASKMTRYGPDFYDRVMTTVVSRENHVRNTLQKVILGEANAAIVYETDARNIADKINTLTIPDDINVRAAYVIAVPTTSTTPSLGHAFIAHVRSTSGKDTLVKHGFTPVE